MMPPLWAMGEQGEKRPSPPAAYQRVPSLSGGTGGKRLNYDPLHGSGGAGGGAEFSASSVTLTGALNLSSGSDGDTTNGGQGAGGAASFTAGTLIAPTIDLTKQDGDLTFTVGALNVNQTTALTLNKGTAPGNFTVSVNGLAFSNGSALTVTRTQGTETFTAFGGNLSVAGAGNALNSLLAFDASGTGKTHTFNLTGLAAGSTMLTAQTSTLNIGGANIALTGDQPALNLGQSVTLLSNTSGTQATASYTTTGAVQYGYAFSNPGGNSLALFHNSVNTSGDWTAPTSTYSADSTNGAVSLKVGGVLSGVSVLNLTEAGGNNLTVDIGTLDAVTNNLTVNLTGTTAGNGVTGVRFDTLNLGGGNTFQITGAGAYTGFNTYNVYGQSTYQGNLNAAGKAMHFLLPSTASSGQTLLTVNGNADLTGTNINLGHQSVRPNLAVGQSLTLLSATALTHDITTLTV